jgi:hypothetical protein
MIAYEASGESLPEPKTTATTLSSIVKYNLFPAPRSRTNNVLHITGKCCM